MSTTRLMPSPREELADLTRTRTMETLASIVRSGQDFTFEKLSRNSGVPLRTLYRHHRNKEHLFGAFWHWVNSTLAIPAAPLSPADLVKHIPLLFAAFDQDEALVRAMLHHPDGRGVRTAHAEQRRAKFQVALAPILAGISRERATNLLASVTALCSASGWETMKDNWQLDASAAAKAAQWAVAALLSAAADQSPKTAGASNIRKVHQ